jgi:hypothetical protein
VHQTWCQDAFIFNAERRPAFGLVNVDYNIDKAHAGLSSALNGDDYDGYVDDDVDDNEGYVDGLMHPIQEGGDGINTTILKLQNKFLASCQTVGITCRQNVALVQMLKVYLFGIKVSLSELEGDELLRLLQNFTSYPFVGRQYRALKAAADKLTTDNLKIEPYNYSIPLVFDDNETKLFTGHHNPVLHVVGEMMMPLCEDDLHLQAPPDDRIYKEPSTGTEMRKMYAHVAAEYGEDFVPLPLAINLDDVALNKVGSRGGKPVYLTMASIKAEKYWDKDNIRCVGFAPEGKVRYLKHSLGVH